MGKRGINYEYLKPRGGKDFYGINLYQKMLYWFNDPCHEKIDFYTYMRIYTSLKKADVSIISIMPRYIRKIMNDNISTSEVIKEVEENYGLIIFTAEENEYLKNCIAEFMETHKEGDIKHASPTEVLRQLFKYYLTLDKSITDFLEFDDFERFMKIPNNIVSAKMKDWMLESCIKNEEACHFIMSTIEKWNPAK